MPLPAPALDGNYFDVGDAAVDKGEGFDGFEAVHDGHVAEVFEDQFDGLDFVHLLPDAVFESVHAFLGEGRLTMTSRRALSVFLDFSPGAYIFKLSLYLGKSNLLKLPPH